METTISKIQFQAYEEVRASGITNMWDVDFVCELSGLEREECLEIMKNYSELNAKYPGVRKSPQPARPTQTGN